MFVGRDSAKPKYYMSITGMIGRSFGMNVHLQQASYNSPIAQILRVCFKEHVEVLGDKSTMHIRVTLY